MKAGWEVKALGSVCRVIGGGTPSKSNAEFYTGSIPWATVRDMRSGVISDTECKITTEAIRSSATNIIPGGNVVIATRVGLGKVCLLGQDTAINQDLRGIIPYDPRILSVRFLYLWLTSAAHLIVEEGTGATVQGVKLPFIKSLLVPLPPLPEQRRIVGILDEAFAAIATAKANTEANLANARAVFDSRLHEVFSQRGEGWVERRLGELIEVQNGFAFRSNEYAASGHFLIRIGNVQDGSITLANPQYVDLSDPKLKRFELDDGDVLISLTGNIGRVAIIRNEHLPAALNQRVARITTKEGNVDRDFIFRFLSSRAFREGLQEAGHGAAQQNVSTKEIGSVVLHIPNLNAQRRIADELDSLATETQRLESIYRRKLEAMEALKKSLLHAAFEGEL